MTVLVLEACAAVELLLQTPLGSRVARALDDADVVVAPDLIDVEVMSALRRLERSGHLRADDADQALARFLDLPLDLVGQRPLTRVTWRHRDYLQLTDAEYVACAELFDGALLTTDRRLARALHGVPVVDLGT